MFDKKLLEAIAKKDVKAYNQFYNKYSDWLYDWALGRIGDEDIADDISQNFWILLWEEPEIVKLDENASAKRFLLHLFNLRMIDYLRAASTRLLSLKGQRSIAEISEISSYTHVYEDFELTEFNSIINSIIAGLPETLQEIFTLLYKEELSIKETAKRLNMNEKTVSYKSKKTIALIREKLELLQSDDAENLGKLESFTSLLILLSLLK
ncbi:RNA polymerase sigma factor [Dysgonomonas termitidis]|uniref:RNA polymerase sigma factor n=1 Tax=Dysgonomonas termitidis TaxID=1516126 RepID=A0ABV9KS78_9BACT